MILGGALVVALFAALIGPLFVNWNDYRASFEVEASRILGHRVHVAGDAKATILPSPSLTFTDVAVEDEDGTHIMDVARFSVVIELMPLLQGEIRVVSMDLEQPVVNVTAGADGTVAWLSRRNSPEPFDPDKVVLDDVTVTDGTLNFDDRRSGVAFSVAVKSAAISARSLLGPWHVSGFYEDAGQQVQFTSSTGRVLDDGTLRVKFETTPARWPVAVAADGAVGIDPAVGLTYTGTYSLNELADGDGESAATGWRSEGAFTLAGDRLAITKAVLTNGPADRAFGLAGGLDLRFGASPSFKASAQSRQIDLDRSLGAGPSEPVDVSVATADLVDKLSHLPVPGIPGSIALDVPAIVVGGRVIENVTLKAEPAASGWHVSELSARLPGQARVVASGLLETDEDFGFNGDVELAVSQPATFATWWRGRGQDGAGRLLAPFDLAGHADISPKGISVRGMRARVGDAEIDGTFSWGEVDGKARELNTDLSASRVDFVQLKALAELLVGHNLTNADSLAKAYQLHVKADAFVFEDVTIRGVEINADYRDDALTVTKLEIGDIGGARVYQTSGKIDRLSERPRGGLSMHVHADDFSGVSRLANRFAPDSGVARWLQTAAPALGPADFSAQVQAPPPQADNGFLLTVKNGVAGDTAFDLSLRSAGGLGTWREKSAEVALTVHSPDSSALARQFGVTAMPISDDAGAAVFVKGVGVPAEGLETTASGDYAGLAFDANGKLAVAEDLSPSFDGSVDLNSPNIDPIIALAGLAIPGAATGTAVEIGGNLNISSGQVTLEWLTGKVGATIAGGKVSLSGDGARGWQIGGDLHADEVDLGWLTALGLSFPPVLTDDPDAPWSRTPFAGPAYGHVTGRIAVAADRLHVGDLSLTGVALDLALQPQRIDVDVTSAQIAGGTVTGGVSVHNVGGNANLAARFDMKNAALESFVWKRDGRAVATGLLDLSANFEATGRSPAGLVSTMTGGGVVTIHDGTARYINPGTVRQLVRASDLGQQFSEDALKLSFAERIDADDLTFTEASGAFAIVAGAVRLKNLTLANDGLTATGNAVADLNAMTLDSDWNLIFRPVDDKGDGSDPKAGMVFRGSLVAPSRTLDVLPFASYLNAREAARMNEIIALDNATRAEKERLRWLTRRLSEDAEWRAEQERLAAEREAARHAAVAGQAATVATFHVNREVLVERRDVAALVTWADRRTAESGEATDEAAATAKSAAAARKAADAAATAAAGAATTEQAAHAALDVAKAALADAKADAESAQTTLQKVSATAAEADAALAQATAGGADAQGASTDAVTARTEADAALKAATGKTATAGAAADKAELAAAKAADGRDRADAVVAAAEAELVDAEAALATAEDAVKVAEAAANEAATSDTTLGKRVGALKAAKDAADAAAADAVSAVDRAAAARQQAQSALDAVTPAAEAARAAADAALANAKMAETLAAQVAAPDGSDDTALSQSNAAKTLADQIAAQAATKVAAADAAEAERASAQAGLDAADKALADAKAEAERTANAATKADEALKKAVAAAARSGTSRDVALTGLRDAMKSRDTAKSVRDGKATALAKAKTAAATAADLAAKSEAAAQAARAEADKAEAARAEAEAIAEAAARTVEETGTTQREATAALKEAQAAAKAAADDVARAERAATAADAVVTKQTTALEEATAAAETASARRIAAAKAAESAARRADVAEAAATEASRKANAATELAQAAKARAEQAQQALAPVDTIEIVVPPRQPLNIEIAPVNAAAPAGPAPVVSASPPMPRSAPAVPR